jgi:hypothetical protein
MRLTVLTDFLITMARVFFSLKEKNHRRRIGNAYAIKIAI